MKIRLVVQSVLSQKASQRLLQRSRQIRTQAGAAALTWKGDLSGVDEWAQVWGEEGSRSPGQLWVSQQQVGHRLASLTKEAVVTYVIFMGRTREADL